MCGNKDYLRLPTSDCDFDQGLTYCTHAFVAVAGFTFGINCKQSSVPEGLPLFLQPQVHAAGLLVTESMAANCASPIVFWP